jgi:glycosyltransferase involved in cell wall biosynthesis
MKVSIVIPTLNEEELLPLLLKDLSKQTFYDFEVIISDAGSTDKTIEIAKEYNAKVTQGGLPAIGRNNGAKIAQGDFIFFFDSDIRIPNDFIENAYKELQNRFLDLATCEFIPNSQDNIDKFLHNTVNIAIKIYQYIDPHAPGFCLLISKRLFNLINGFDETLKLAEDHDFVKRASKFSPLRVLDSTYISVSTRRLSKEGRRNLVRKYLQVELYRLVKGEIREDIVDYEFGNFDKVEKSPDYLQKINNKINDLKNLLDNQNKLSFKDNKLIEKEEQLVENLHNIENQFDKLKKMLKEILSKEI